MDDVTLLLALTDRTSLVIDYEVILICL